MKERNKKKFMIINSRIIKFFTHSSIVFLVLFHPPLTFLSSVSTKNNRRDGDETRKIFSSFPAYIICLYHNTQNVYILFLFFYRRKCTLHRSLMRIHNFLNFLPFIIFAPRYFFCYFILGKRVIESLF